MPRLKESSSVSGCDVPLVPLRVNDLLMLKAYFSNGQNATQAYLTVHPKAKYSTGEVNGHKWLRKAKIQAEIARRMQVDAGITRELVESDLLTARQWALDRKNPLELASVAIDCAKLAGFLVEKREIKTITEEESNKVRRLVQQMLDKPDPNVGCN